MMRDLFSVSTLNSSVSSENVSKNPEDIEKKIKLQQHLYSCRAPIASLDCMEELNNALSPTSQLYDHTLSSPPQISRQSSSFSAGVNYRNLGKSGLKVSNMALSTWSMFGSHLSDDVIEDIVTHAYDNGINVFDVSEAYMAGKCESTIGKILKKKDWKRSSYIVVTKINWNGKGQSDRGLSRKKIVEGLQASLDRLQLGYVDVVFANKIDLNCPMEEIVRAFTFCINQGMALYWGTARWTPHEIMEAYVCARQFGLIPPSCEQAEYHMFCRNKVEIHLSAIYHKTGLGVMTWSPLSCGILTNKCDDGTPPATKQNGKQCQMHPGVLPASIHDDYARQHAKMKEIALLAEKLGYSLTQLIIAWCLKSKDSHCVLVGATSLESLYDNLQALQLASRLNPAIIVDMERILENKPQLSSHINR